jgi:hypothetical protein
MTRNMPGFTAEHSIYRTEAVYSTPDGGGVVVSGHVVPQLQECGQCSGVFIGSRLCCDKVIKCEPGGGCSTDYYCTRTPCSGLLDALVSIFGGFLS